MNAEERTKRMLKTFASVVGLVVVLGTGATVQADQTLTTELIKVSAEDTLICDAANVGQRAVEATVAIIIVPPMGAPVDPIISATFCEASLLASNFVCSHTATPTPNTIVPGTRAYCQVVVAGPASKVRATLRNEMTGEKSDAR
jgi:hypothetical protein